MPDTQTYHILLHAVYNQFADHIDGWTGGAYTQNAGYNLVQLPKDTSGAWRP